jgi:transposase InsO family protein
MENRVEAKAAELSLTPRRVFQLLQRWRDDGIIGLADGRKTRARNPLANTDPRLIEAIRDQYEAEVDDTAASIGGRFKRRVENRLAQAHGPGVVPMPSRSTWYRIVEAILPRSPNGPTNTRRTQAAQPDRTFGTIHARRPGELVMVDTTRLDVIAYDPVTDTNTSCELTVALDVATRSILAWRLTLRSTRGLDLGLLLADMMTPEPMRAHWPDSLRWSMSQLPIGRLMSLERRMAAAAMRPVIYPEAILIDHGSQYQSEVMRRACRRLGIQTFDARVYKATDKPQIERLFKTIRTQFSEHVAGYKGHDIAHRGRRSGNDARWSITEIEEFFAEYVVAIYQRQPHSGLHAPGQPRTSLSPNEAYGLAVAAEGYITCPDDPDLYFDMLPIKWRRIHPRGIEIDRLHYDGDILYRYRSTRSPYSGQYQGKWPIHIDPRDYRHAYLRDPDNGTWHTLRWIHADNDLLAFTDTTLRECKRLLAIRNHDTGDQHAIAAALRELQDRTDAPESWSTNRRRTRLRDNERARAAARDRSQSTVDRAPAEASWTSPAAGDVRANIDLSDLGSFGVIEFGPIPGED